jgi:hypothetical protein
MYCQMFSTGLSSGFGGRARIVMLAGMSNLADRCHPGLIDEEDGVGSWFDRLGDFREVQVHRCITGQRRGRE